MTKTVKAITVGNGTRHVTTLTDIPSHGAEIALRQFDFLKEVSVDGAYAGLLHCGPLRFETLKMYHSGEAWTVVMEAEELL